MGCMICLRLLLSEQENGKNDTKDETVDSTETWLEISSAERVWFRRAACG